MTRRRAWGPVAAVAAATLAGGWAGVLADRARGEAHGMQSTGAGVWIATPLAAVTLVRLLRRGRVRGGWDPRARPGWYAVGAAAFPVVDAVVLGAGRAAGLADADQLDGRRLLRAAAVAAGPAMAKNVLEEAVWRGFFTSELVERRVPDAGIYLGTGVLWGLWHVPYYLYFLPEETMREVLDVPRPVFALVATAVTTAWAVPFAELFRLSGSVWPCVVMHTVEDALNPLVFDGHVRIRPGHGVLLSPVAGVLPAALHVGLGLALRAVRSRRGRV